MASSGDARQRGQGAWFRRRIRTHWRLFARRFFVLPARKLVRRYREDPWFRAAMSMKMSAVINAFFVIYQTINAFTRGSYWFGVLAAYYTVLTVMRVIIVGYMENDAPDGREELRRFRRIGGFLLLLTGVVISMGIVVNRVGHRPSYPGHMIIVMVVFTLYNAVFAVINFVKYRRLEDPVIEASKALTLATTFVSFYTLQAAAIGWLDAIGGFARFLNWFTPIVVFLGVAAVSIVMISRATWALSFGQRADEYDEWITGEHAAVRLMELRQEALARFKD